MDTHTPNAMKTIKILFGFLPGVSLRMWLKGMWFCIALCMCNPADDAPLWVVFALIAHVVVAGLAVAGDREKWKKVSNNLNEM